MEKEVFFYDSTRQARWFEAHKNTHIRVIPQIRVEDKSDLDLFLDEVQSKGGEGVVVKDPEMPYHTGRSAHVLKVKKFGIWKVWSLV